MTSPTQGEPTGIYLRISDDREGRELGVDRQEEDCRRLAERHGDTVIAVFKDNDIGASTRSRKPRPDYARLMEAARTGRITKIIAYTSGRLTRRPREHEGQIELAERHGVTFEYVASPSFDLNTAAGRRIARILAANDAGESEDIGERVQRSHRQLSEQGGYRGGRRPFGYLRDGVTLEPRESEAIALGTRLALAGASWRSIAGAWNTSGVLTPSAVRWDGANVRRVLTRMRNAGLVEFHGDVVGTAQWPAIVTQDEVLAVRAIERAPERKYSGNRSLVFVGASLYLCGKCEIATVMRSATTGRHADGSSVLLYRCARESHNTILAAATDQYVEGVAEGVLERDGGDLLVSTEQDTTAALYRELEALRLRAVRLAELFAAGEVAETSWAVADRKITTDSKVIRDQLAAQSGNSALVGIADAPDPVKAYRDAPTEQRRAVIGELMTVTIMPSVRGKVRRYRDMIDLDRIVIDPKVKTSSSAIEHRTSTYLEVEQ